MSWTWRPTGSTRGIFHAFESWSPTVPGREIRYEPACGGKGDDTELDPDGRFVCLGCRRKLIERTTP